MKDMHSDPTGPQLYLLSEEAYEDLRNIQTMLTLMAHIAYSEDDAANGNVVLKISRADLYYYFQEISAQIGDALDRLSKENWTDTHSRLWQ
ncbi:XAC0095 family protein [Dyella psychrodurans]|uniref:XAC0095-like domain-containing protein n=1 Tax=Dyella psychrodurans TaxID=1927960 RepID=A0A370WUH9_9GAMM|nr:hypothetical protein [Dyella psychrodurans]RDS79798.1 hypothetical protein DWU99_20590 [Dyella psychrodurans]